eukprot:m.89938 g.89938  ORF g.89938 m.89938 type:complete len:438 (-) comp8842_c1_seq1:271-1584(-)
MISTDDDDGDIFAEASGSDKKKQKKKKRKVKDNPFSFQAFVKNDELPVIQKVETVPKNAQRPENNKPIINSEPQTEGKYRTNEGKPSENGGNSDDERAKENPFSFQAFLKRSDTSSTISNTPTSTQKMSSSSISSKTTTTTTTAIAPTNTQSHDHSFLSSDDDDDVQDEGKKTKPSKTHAHGKKSNKPQSPVLKSLPNEMNSDLSSIESDEGESATQRVTHSVSHLHIQAATRNVTHGSDSESSLFSDDDSDDNNKGEKGASLQLSLQQQQQQLDMGKDQDALLARKYILKLRKLKKEKTQLEDKCSKLETTLSKTEKNLKIVTKQLQSKKEREIAEANQLQSMAEQVEKNLEVASKRAVVAENKAAALQAEVLVLRTQLQQFAMGVSQFDQMKHAAGLLYQAAKDADTHIKGLLGGVTTLEQVGMILDNLQKFEPL